MDVVQDADNGYEGYYVSVTNIKVLLASKYIFVIKNLGEARIEIRIGYRNTSVNPRTFSNSADVSDYSIESLNNRSNTKIRDFKDGYIRFNIESKDTAKISIGMINDDFDQLVFIPVHKDAAVSLLLIQTDAVVGEHVFEDGYHSDDNNHWKECIEDGCAFISEKGEHTWVDDETKDDVKPTETESGIKYEVCSVCGRTREVVLPPEDTSLIDEDNDISNRNFTKGYNVTDGGIDENVHSQNSLKSRKVVFGNANDTGRFIFDDLFVDLTGKTLVFDVKFGDGASTDLNYFTFQARIGEKTRYEIKLKMSENPAGVKQTILEGAYADWQHFEIDIDTAVVGKSGVQKTNASEYGFIATYLSTDEDKSATFYFDNIYLSGREDDTGEVDDENDITNGTFVKSYNAVDLGLDKTVHSENSVQSRAIKYTAEQDTGRFNFEELFQDLSGKRLVFDVKVGEGALSTTYLKLHLRTGEKTRYEISLRMSDNPAGVTRSELTGDYEGWAHYEIDVDTAVAGKTGGEKTSAGEYGFVGAHISNTVFYFDNMFVITLKR